LKWEGRRGNQKKALEMEGQKQEGKNKRAEVGAKNERVERELEGKFLPFSWFSFVVFLRVFSSLCLRRRKRW
jgi:hypothetical protein